MYAAPASPMRAVEEMFEASIAKPIAGQRVPREARK
jgi:hypothetical protein